MIDLCYWPTPNGHKITLFLEEAGLPYQLKPVNIGQGEQFFPAFLQVSPNNRIPAIVDDDSGDTSPPLSVFESGAILMYLAEKTGRFSPRSLTDRHRVNQWLFWQVGGLGPMVGQNLHFNRFAPEKVPYAQQRYLDETARLFSVLNRQLEHHSFVAGKEYSIADMAIYPWIAVHEWAGQALEDYPNLEVWFNTVKARPATQRAYAIGESFKASQAKQALPPPHAGTH